MQFCGSGEPLDLNKNNDIAHRHSGTSVPHDADMKAAREGQAQVRGNQREGGGQQLLCTTLCRYKALPNSTG